MKKVNVVVHAEFKEYPHWEMTVSCTKTIIHIVCTYVNIYWIYYASSFIVYKWYKTHKIQWLSIVRIQCQWKDIPDDSIIAEWG